VQIMRGRGGVSARVVLGGVLTAVLLVSIFARDAKADVAPHNDVMFVFDTSGSMEDALYEAASEISIAMSEIQAQLPDVEFGLSEVRDYGEEPEYVPWHLDVPITSSTAAINAGINGLFAEAGGDSPEAYGRALWEADTNPMVGWRSGARHMIVLVADDVPHDNDLDEGIPSNLWVEPDPWDTGYEPGEPADIPDTLVKPWTNLDWQSVLAQLSVDQKPLEYVDYEGVPGYLPYWENWAARTGGEAVSSGEGLLTADLVAVAKAGATVPPPPPSPAPASPPSAPPPAAPGPCAPMHSSVAKMLLASLKCTAAMTAAEAKCAADIFVGKELKAFVAGKDLADLSKLPAPVAKLVRAIKDAKFLKTAPPGYRTWREVVDRLSHAKDAIDLVQILPRLAQAVSSKDLKEIALDFGDIAGAKACVQGLILAME
jgi:hypothetical protein